MLRILKRHEPPEIEEYVHRGYEVMCTFNEVEWCFRILRNHVY